MSPPLKLANRDIAFTEWSGIDNKPIIKMKQQQQTPRRTRDVHVTCGISSVRVSNGVFPRTAQTAKL